MGLLVTLPDWLFTAHPGGELRSKQRSDPEEWTRVSRAVAVLVPRCRGQPWHTGIPSVRVEGINLHPAAQLAHYWSQSLDSGCKGRAHAAGKGQPLLPLSRDSPVMVPMATLGIHVTTCFSMQSRRFIPVAPELPAAKQQGTDTLNLHLTKAPCLNFIF